MNQVFVDSSFLFAYFVESDTFHTESQNIFQAMAKQQLELVVSNFILDETYTLLRIKSNLPTALALRQALENSKILLTIIRVTVDDEADAWEWFTKPWSKLSYTDCVSFALMKRLGLTQVATFDVHFAKAGFKIIKP